MNTNTNRVTIVLGAVVLFLILSALLWWAVLGIAGAGRGW